MPIRSFASNPAALQALTIEHEGPHRENSRACATSAPPATCVSRCWPPPAAATGSGPTRAGTCSSSACGTLWTMPVCQRRGGWSQVSSGCVAQGPNGNGNALGQSVQHALDHACRAHWRRRLSAQAEVLQAVQGRPAGWARQAVGQLIRMNGWICDSRAAATFRPWGVHSCCIARCR